MSEPWTITGSEAREFIKRYPAELAAQARRDRRDKGQQRPTQATPGQPSPVEGGKV